MKPAVRASFLRFTAPLEGSVPWMYLDILGLVTVAVGNLIDPIGYTVLLPFVRPDGSPASESEIAEAWHAVKSRPELAKQGYRAAERVTSVRLTPFGIETVVLKKLDEIDAALSRRFADYPSWPADAQLATLSMAWACGAAFHFPRLDAALRALDFARFDGGEIIGGAAFECTINEHGNPGVVPRNAANRLLYANAAHVREQGLDPDVLYWPKVLDDAVADTDPPGVEIAIEGDIKTLSPLDSIVTGEDE